MNVIFQKGDGNDYHFKRVTVMNVTFQEGDGND